MNFDVTVVELVLSPEMQRTGPRSISVRMDLPAGTNEDSSAELETRPIAQRGAFPLRYDYSHTLSFTPGTPECDALLRALDGSREASDIYFVVCDGATGKSLGEASVCLQALERSGNEQVATTSLAVNDVNACNIGRLRVCLSLLYGCAPRATILRPTCCVRSL